MGNTSGAGEELLDLVIFLKQKGKKEKKKRNAEVKIPALSIIGPSDRSALSLCSQKMRGLNPDRNPCVQGSIRSLGFNFTDWFAPFFSVRILTSKVACAEPLYYCASVSVSVCVKMKKESARRMASTTSENRKRNEKKSTEQEEAHFVSRVTVILTREKERDYLLNLHMSQSTCFGT